MSVPKLLLAEDHELVGQGLKAMLSAEYEIADIVQDGAEVVSAVMKHKPDVLLLDLSLPHRNGIDLLTDLFKARPRLRVLVLTMHVDPHLANMAMSLGARGFVPKNAGLEELRTAIEVIREGGKYLSPKIPEQGHRGNVAGPMGFSQLTTRQQKIVRMLAKGMSSEEIADELGVTVHTVAFHRKNIRRALGVKSDLEMHRYAILVGLSEENKRADRTS
jgi:DNA-binding NarL/FixJ family response regulator